MPTIKDTITTLATDAGYDGDRPQTIADAIEAYGAVAGGGGGGVSIMKVTVSGGVGSTVCDKTYADVLAHLQAGGIAIAGWDPLGNGSEFVYQLSNWNLYVVTFTRMQIDQQSDLSVAKIELAPASNPNDHATTTATTKHVAFKS